MYCHSTVAASESGVTLGVLDAWMWARQAKGEPDIRESTRWTEGYQRVAELKEELSSTEIVYVADREADIRELIERGTTARKHCSLAGSCQANLSHGGW